MLNEYEDDDTRHFTSTECGVEVELRGYPMKRPFQLQGRNGNVVQTSDTPKIMRGWRLVAVCGQTVSTAREVAAALASAQQKSKYTVSFNMGCFRKPRKLAPLPQTLEHQYATWKAKRGASKEQRFFVICVPYESLRPQMLIEALLERGWLENRDENSINNGFYDFLWSVQSSEVQWEKLRPWQIVNHTQSIEELTRKGRLYRHLRQVHCMRSVSADNFVPRSYDLATSHEIEGFLQDFKATYAESLVRRLSSGEAVPTSVAVVALRITARCLATLERHDFELDDSFDETFDGQKVDAAEWDVLTQGNVDEDSSSSVDLQHNAQDILQRLESLSRSANPQVALNGIRNLWILKPAEQSRGNGIMVMDSLLEISKYFKGYFSVQKYQENPLLIARDNKGVRKHDIRLYVLIESWEPLRVWCAKEALIRFAARTYDVTDNRSAAVHLTNVSVGKRFTGDALVWSSTYYAEHLKAQYSSDVYYDVIEPQMKEIARNTVACLRSEMQQTHAGSAYEFVGFDLIVSEDFRVWLLEVNEMPAMSSESPDAKRLYRAAVRDTIRVIFQEPSEDEFFTLLMNEPPLDFVEPLISLDLTLYGIGYRILDSGVRPKTPLPEAVVSNLTRSPSVKDFLDRINAHRAKERAKFEQEEAKREASLRGRRHSQQALPKNRNCSSLRLQAL